MVDLGEATALVDCNPVDAVQCQSCGLVFQASQFENDGTYITSWDEFELVPRFCPHCGERVVRCDE